MTRSVHDVAGELAAYHFHRHRERIPHHSSQRNSDLDLSVSFSPFLIQKAERFAKLTDVETETPIRSRGRDPLHRGCTGSHTQRLSARLKNYRTVVKERKPLKAAVKLAKG